MTATTVRAQTGFHRWKARCAECKWTRAGGSREGAKHLAAFHNRTRHAGESVPEVDPV